MQTMSQEKGGFSLGSYSRLQLSPQPSSNTAVSCFLVRQLKVLELSRERKAIGSAESSWAVSGNAARWCMELRRICMKVAPFLMPCAAELQDIWVSL